MTEFENTEDASRGLNRRTVIKGAAWSVPVVAAAVGTPLAAASEGNSALRWGSSTTSLIDLRLLSGGDLIGLNVLLTRPLEFILDNGPGAIDATANITVVVGRPSGIPLSVGRARGFGVYSLDGTVVSAQNSTSYQSALGVQYGFPITTFTGTHHFSGASSSSINVPIVFGLSGVNDLVTVSLLANFPVTLTVDFGGGNVYTASSTISVPAGAGVL